MPGTSAPASAADTEQTLRQLIEQLRELIVQLAAARGVPVPNIGAGPASDAVAGTVAGTVQPASGLSGGGGTATGTDAQITVAGTVVGGPVADQSVLDTSSWSGGWTLQSPDGTIVASAPVNTRR